MMNDNDNDCLFGRATSPIHDDINSNLHEMAAFYSDDTHILEEDDGNDELGYAITNSAPPPPPPPPPHVLDMLPKATASQHLAMDEFIKAPSKDLWQQLVEDMRREREQQMIEFYRANNNGEDPPHLAEMRLSSPGRGSISPRKRSPRKSTSPRKSSRNSPRKSRSSINSSSSNSPRDPIASVSPSSLSCRSLSYGDNVKPDPPSDCDVEDDDSMGGWTMRGANSKINRSIAIKQSFSDAEEVSQQLKSMLRDSSRSPNSDYSTDNYGDDEELGTTASYPESHSSKCAQLRYEMRRQRKTICIFTWGFLLGIVLIVGLSLAFDETPAEELHALRAYGRNENIGDSRDYNNITSQGNNTLQGGSGNEDEENENENEGDEEEVNEEEEEEEEEEDYSDLFEFCAECLWKCTGWSCKERVEWEMREYKLTEHEAMRANLNHCSMGMPQNNRCVPKNSTDNEDGG